MAVKTLKTGSTVEEKLDFLGEADMMKRFDHKNIVKLLGVCTRNEPIYTVMEFMLYGDLKTYLLARYANKTYFQYRLPRPNAFFKIFLYSGGRLLQISMVRFSFIEFIQKISSKLLQNFFNSCAFLFTVKS